MPNPGFSSRGFYVDKFIFGGGPPYSAVGFAAEYDRRDFVTTTTTLLTEDLVAHSITINDAVLVQTNRIIARDTITINSGGIVVADGTSGQSGRVAGAYSGPINSLHQGFSGGDGAPADFSAMEGEGSEYYGLAGRYVSTPVRYGGKGGSASSGPYAAGKDGGYSSLSAYHGGPNVYQPSIWQSATVFGPKNNTPGSHILDAIKCGGGAGGGGGGASTTEVGWGGGAGGGVIWMAADKIIFNSPGVKISANGGNASNRSSSAGNGGGGQGGVVILVCNELIFKDHAAYISVAGGLGGTGNGDARDGLNGNYGRILIFSSQAVQDFLQLQLGLNVNPFDFEWENAKKNYKTP